MAYKVGIIEKRGTSKNGVCGHTLCVREALISFVFLKKRTNLYKLATRKPIITMEYVQE